MNSLLSCTLYCHALVTVMHFLLKTEDFVQNRFLILHFWLRKKVYSEQNPPLLVTKTWKTSPLGVFFFFFIRFFVKTWKTSTFGGFLLKSEDFVQNRLPILHFWCFFFSKILHFWLRKLGFFDPSERNKVQEHFKITTQLIFLMPPTSPASFVQIGALWIFFVPRVPPLHHFSFLVAHTPTRCKQTSKSLPSLFFWWSPPVLQVSSRLEHFEFFFFQGSPLWIFSGFW